MVQKWLEELKRTGKLTGKVDKDSMHTPWDCPLHAMRTG